MYRTNQTKGRRSDRTRNLGVLTCVALISACATAVPESSGENLGSAQESLLTTACTTTGGNLALQIKANEVGYVGKVAGCTVEPCVFANALDSSGNICRINSTGKTITVTSTGAAGVEKMVVDYANGLFAMAATTPLVSVSLDTGSKLMVIPPIGGGNMALGVTGLDANTLLARAATPLVDITMSGVDFLFNGGAGNDVFTGDAAGWTAAPTGWNTSAAIAAAVGAATTLDLTISGGAGNDTLAGGAGVNSLLGGAGNDTFVQSTSSRAETMNGGDGIDTVDYGVRSAPVRVSVGINSAVATVALGAAGTGYTVGDVLTLAAGKLGAATVTVASITGGAGTGPVGTVTVTSGGSGYAVATGVATTGGTGTGCTIDVSTLSADDGAVGEADDVQATVEIIKGGAGDDILNAYAISSTDVVLLGNAGNDQLTGGSGNDDLCGGAGDDKFYSNPGDDNLVGGAGIDTADYSASTGVVACLNVADTASGKPCAAQNGPTGQKDVINGALTKVCPRAALTIDVGGTPTAGQAVPTASQGGAMAVDVENLTGHPTSANALYCGTLACTLFGGSAADTLYGGASGDAIYGLGGADTVFTKGGNDLVDLTHAGASVLVTVDCNSNQVTILKAGLDTTAYTNCGFANTP
jgi:Ca2+-binding RTX toxin-like protein